MGKRALRARYLLLGRPCEERSGRRQGFLRGVVRLGGKGHAGRGGGTYTMLRLDGDEVCGLYKMEPERREQGIPPHWFFYVSVEDADATTSRARELGGMVYGEAFDVLDSGRMAVIQDPTGAMIAAWQSRAHVDATARSTMSAVLPGTSFRAATQRRRRPSTPDSLAGRRSL